LNLQPPDPKSVRSIQLSYEGILSSVRVQNLRKVFEQSGSSRHQDRRGSLVQDESALHRDRRKAWIHEARMGAAVFAALSPNNDYHGNLRDADRLLEAAKNKIGIDDFKVSTYGNNKRKAWSIANGVEPLDVIVFPKTRSFFLNIFDPLDPHPVTVDGHIYNAWHGRRISLKGAAQKGSHKLYEEGRSGRARTGQGEGRACRTSPRGSSGIHGAACTAFCSAKTA
jgi:hypothetical protein